MGEILYKLFLENWTDTDTHTHRPTDNSKPCKPTLSCWLRAHVVYFECLPPLKSNQA